MSTDSYIQVPPDSTGKMARSISKTVGAVEVHQEVNVIGSPRKLSGAYSYASPTIAGSTVPGYVYLSFFYPATATRLLAVRRIYVQVVTVAAAVYISFCIYRTTAASGGTARPVTDVCKKDTAYPDPTIDLRDTGVTVTLAQRLFSFISPGAVGQITGIHNLLWVREDGRDDLILRPGEGICLGQEAAGDADFRVMWFIEWEEFEGLTVVT